VGVEVLQVDRVLALDLDGLEVLVGQMDELSLRVFEGLDDLVVTDGLVLQLADLLVADRPVVLLVDEVELQPVLVHGAVQPDGNVDEPERDRAAPERTRCHDSNLLGRLQPLFRGRRMENPARSRAHAGLPQAGSCYPNGTVKTSSRRTQASRRGYD